MDSAEKLLKVIQDMILKETSKKKTIIARVKSIPPNITLEYGGQIIPTGQIYINNVLLPHYNRTYTLEGNIDEITIDTTTSNITAANHVHKHGTIEGSGSYKTNGNIWLENTLEVGNEVLVELVGNLFVVVAQVVKMPNNAIEGLNMSEFDDNFFDVTETDNTSSYPVFRELAIDFETGEYLTENDDYIYVEKDEALKVWIWKALKTERNKYLYSDSFGNELHEEIGQVYNREVKQQLIYNEIQECLIVNPYITRVYNFSSEYSDDNATLKVTFSVETLYNVIEEVQEIYV